MRIEHTIEIDAPIEEVWDLTLRVEDLPTMTPTMTAVERLDDGPLALGSTASIKQPGQPTRTWTVTVVEAPTNFAWSTRALGMTMTGIHELRPTGDQTTSNTLAIRLDGRLAPLLGPLLRRTIHKALATENEGFKRAAEGADRVRRG